jgi:hypothetical protein
MFKSRLLAQFFDTWKNSSFDDAVEDLPDDNSKTPANEGVTAQQLNEFYKRLGHDNFSSNSNPTDLLKSMGSEDLNEVTKIIYRKSYAKTANIDMMVSGLQDQIDDIYSAEEDNDVDGGSGGGSF